jgi:hypothetical protein
MPRVKCIRTKAYPGAQTDPILERGMFYDVIGEEPSLADPTPMLIVQRKGQQITRPRCMFGKILIN